MLLLGSLGITAFAQKVDTIKKRVDGGVAFSTNDIATSLSLIKPLSRFGQLITTAGLDSILHAAGPVTVLVPDDNAFLHSGIDVADSLTKPANKTQLARLLLNHIIKGKISIADIKRQIDENSGTATLTTLEGGKITVIINANRNVVLTDEINKTSIISKFNIPASNGYIQILNGVLLPGN